MWRFQACACSGTIAALATLSGVALNTCACPTAQTGARSQAPMHGARTTRTFGPSLPGSVASSLSAPAIAQDSEFADAHRDRRRRRLAFLHDIEMRVEGGDLIDLGLRQLHFSGERGHVRGRDVPVFVLNEMQMLDQQIAPARLVAEQRADFGGGFGIDLAAFRRAARFPPARRRAVSVRRHRSLDIHGSELNRSRSTDNPVPSMA